MKVSVGEVRAFLTGEIASADHLISLARSGEEGFGEMTITDNERRKAICLRLLEVVDEELMKRRQ